MTIHLARILTCAFAALTLLSQPAIGAETDSGSDKDSITQKAEQGISFAQFNLGTMYANGHGVIQDRKEAAKWYRKAAEQGFAPAQDALGYMYGLGHGVIQDYVQAHAWFNVASANGDKNAQKGREIVAKEMTPEQIAKAQELAKVYFEKYQPKK